MGWTCSVPMGMWIGWEPYFMFTKWLSWANFHWWLELVCILLQIHFCCQYSTDGNVWTLTCHSLLLPVCLIISVLFHKVWAWVLQGCWQLLAVDDMLDKTDNKPTKSQTLSVCDPGLLVKPPFDTGAVQWAPHNRALTSHAQGSHLPWGLW